MAFSSSLTLEETRPRLVDGVQFVPFNVHVTYLKNSITGDFLKLSSHEAALAGYFNGKDTFAEILQKHKDIIGNRHLLNVAEILLSLKTSGFIVDETTLPDVQDDGASDVFGALKVFKGFISKDLFQFQCDFRNRVLRKIAGFLTSTMGLFVLALASLVYVTLTPGFQAPFIDFGDFSGPAFSSKFTVGYYLLFLALLWFSVGLLLSIKNLLTAYAINAAGCKVYHPRVRSVCGFIYFDCTTTDMVSAGAISIVKIFGFRMFLPVLLLQLVTAIGPCLPVGHLAPATFKKACFLVAAFSISPLVKTDLNNMLYLMTRSTRDFYQCLSYLGKRYFFRAEKSVSQPRGENDFCLIITLLSLVWLAGIGGFLWNAAQGSFYFIADSFTRGRFSLENAYVPLQVLTLLVPFVVLAAMAMLVGASNVQYMLRAPVHRLTDLSKKIQKSPESGLVMSFIGQLPLFAGLNEGHLALLCARFIIVNYQAGREIILQGTPGDSFYVVLSGKARVVVENESGMKRVVNVLSTGDCFGEIALIENVPRTATVKAVSPVSLLKLDRRHFEEFLAALPMEKMRITDTIRHGKLLMGIPLFSYLSPDQLKYLVGRCRVETFKKDDMLFRQDDVGDKLYIIKEGSVAISRFENDKRILLKTLGPGSVFGEISLVKNIPRPAGATAASDLSVLTVDKNGFYELTGKSLLTGAEFDRLADGRLAEISKNSSMVPGPQGRG
jgi:CRP-like cAMP-binding protein